MAQVIKINAITVPADSGDELAKRFAARAGAVDNQDGFEGFELLQPTDDRNVWLVVTRWRDEESFQAWVSSPAFGHGHQGTDRPAPSWWTRIDRQRTLVLRRCRRLQGLRLRSRVRSHLQRHPAGTIRVSDALRRAGSGRFAQRLVAAADVVPIRPPLADAHQFAMKLVKGTDQIAAAMAADGWLGFERPLPDVFAALVRSKGGLVLDVGANTGFYALVAVSVEPQAEVHAFEPYPPVLVVLKGNLTINRGGQRVRVFEQAVGRAPGHALLHVPTRPHGLIETSASLNSDFRLVGDFPFTSVTVAVTTLDEHMRSVGEHPRVSVIKVDVESLEHEVLAGATSLLARDRPYVIVEVLPTSDIEALEASRSSCGYVDVCLRPHDAVMGNPIAFDQDGWNHLFIPVEALDEGLALIESCGLDVRR